MNDRLIVSRRAQLRTASQPSVKGQLPQWVMERLPALPAPAEPRDPDPVTWRLSLALLGHPDHKLPKRARRNRRGPCAFQGTHGDGESRKFPGCGLQKPMSIPFGAQRNGI